MKYSKTGQFTPEQEKLIKKIGKDIDKLRGMGCVVCGKGGILVAYLTKDYRHSTINYPYSPFELKSRDIGIIDDCGGDDEEYFEIGYITEE